MIRRDSRVRIKTYPTGKLAKGEQDYCDRCGRARPLSVLKANKQRGLLLCEKCHDMEVLD